VNLLKEKFVCVALDARRESGEYKDAEGEFIRATDCVTKTASGSVCVVTAGGKRLTNVGGPGEGMIRFLQGGLKAWAELPEADRKAGVPDRAAPPDPKRSALSMPPGTMVVRVFNRHLGRDEKGELRYALPEDFIPKTSKGQAERFAEAHNDFMWVPEAEWKALVPAEPRKGEAHPLPPTFTLRLFRYHLDPCRGFSEGAAFTRSKATAGRLELKVLDVSAERLSMRLEGNAGLREDGRDEPSVYEPAILGFLDFDRSKGCFTRFDLLALGTASGLPRDANGVVTPRKGAYPLGIAFELVAAPTAAEKLHPRGARDNPGAYLDPR
jgi:hypothetical protein